MTNRSFAQRLSKFARRLIHRTHGQDLVEYALLAGMAVSLVVVVLGDIRTRVVDSFGTTITEIATRTAAAGTVPGGGSGGSGGSTGGTTGGGTTGGTTGGGTTGGTTGGGTTGGGTTGGGNGNGNGGRKN